MELRLAISPAICTKVAVRMFLGPFFDPSASSCVTSHPSPILYNPLQPVWHPGPLHGSRKSLFNDSLPESVTCACLVSRWRREDNVASGFTASSPPACPVASPRLALVQFYVFISRHVVPSCLILCISCPSQPLFRLLAALEPHIRSAALPAS